MTQTLETAKQEILDYYRRHGRRPNSRTLGRVYGYLYSHHGTTIAVMADTLGIPRSRKGPAPGVGGAPRGGTRTLTRTLEGVRSGLAAYYRVHGVRPSGNLPCMIAVDHWLRGRGSSVSQICDELDLPRPVRVKYTDERVHKWVMDFYKEHGRRPKVHEMTGVQNYLYRRHRSTLRKYCDELGLPRARTVMPEFDVVKEVPARQPPTANED